MSLADLDFTTVMGSIFTPVTMVASALAGRGLRYTWQIIHPNKKQLIHRHLRRYSRLYILNLGVCGAASYYVYDKHLTPTPLTGRRRFNIFTHEQMSRLASLGYEIAEDVNGHLVLPEWHPYTKQVTRVCDTLVHANSDIPLLSNIPWVVRVVDSDTNNCVVFDSGEIIIYRGMMDLMENDDQVASVLAHELSHVVLEHRGDCMSS